MKLFLALLLLSSPGLAQLPGTQPSRLTLVEAPKCERLRCLDLTKTEQLMRIDAQLELLEATRPTLAWPLVLLGVGVLMAVNPVVVLWFTLGNAMVAWLMIAPGIALASLGLAFTIERGVRNAQLSEEGERLRETRSALLEIFHF